VTKSGLLDFDRRRLSSGCHSNFANLELLALAKRRGIIGQLVERGLQNKDVPLSGGKGFETCFFKLMSVATSNPKTDETSGMNRRDLEKILIAAGEATGGGDSPRFALHEIWGVQVAPMVGLRLK